MILLTGSCGYIGSNVLYELISSDHEIVCLDNFSNSSRDTLQKLEEALPSRIFFHEVDIKNKEPLFEILKNYEIDSIIHLAAYKSAIDSILSPIKYYKNNLLGLLNLLDACVQFSIDKFIFSSSAAVYGNQTKLPIKEDASLNPLNPYGFTKVYCEEILQEFKNSHEWFNFISLRYFNPAGADPSLSFGDLYSKNIFSAILDSIFKKSKLTLYGSDLPTKDGFPVRDYIHITDLAKSHIAARETLLAESTSNIINIGTGQGSSLIELIDAFQLISGTNINYEVEKLRFGDPIASFADCERSFKVLGFKSKYNLYDMCNSAYEFRRKHQ